MSTPVGKLLVAAGKSFACVNVAGRANFTLGLDFQTLLDELHKNQYPYVIIDLTNCVLMDSTFLGILTGFGLKMSQPNGQPSHRVVELFNPNERVSELLDNLGVSRLFKIARGEAVSLKDCEEIRMPEIKNATQHEIARTCLEAHETLISANPENAARFKDVTRFLSEDLKKQKSAA